VCALALRLALAFAIAPRTAPAGPPSTIDQIASSLAHGAGFTILHGDRPTPTAIVAPATPWITSLAYRSVGHRYELAVGLQCVLGALLPLLIAWLGSLMFGGTVGRLTGATAAADPLLAWACTRLHTETLYSLALLIAAAATAAWVKTPRPGRALGVGITWGLAALVQATAIPLALLVTAWAWAPLGLTVEGRDRLRQTGLILLGLAIAVGPWIARNALALHALVPVTTAAGPELLAGNNPEVWGPGGRRGGPIDPARMPALLPEAETLPEPRAGVVAANRAWRFASPRIAEWPAITLAKLARLWGSSTDDPAAPWGRSGWLERLDPIAIWSAFILPLALWGVARTLKSPRRWFQSLPAIVIVYGLVPAVLFYGVSRMRVPIEPFALLFATAGFEDARRRWRTRARGLRVVEGRRGLV
jgi:hypothetical protein